MVPSLEGTPEQPTSAKVTPQSIHTLRGDKVSVRSFTFSFALGIFLLVELVILGALTAFCLISLKETARQLEMALQPINLLGDLNIQLVRDQFSEYWFDEVACKDGLVHLQNYSKTWNVNLGAWSTHPRKDIHTEAADAIRQCPQGYAGDVSAGLRLSRRERNPRTV